MELGNITVNEMCAQLKINQLQEMYLGMIDEEEQTLKQIQRERSSSLDGAEIYYIKGRISVLKELIKTDD